MVKKGRQTLLPSSTNAISSLKSPTYSAGEKMLCVTAAIFSEYLWLVGSWDKTLWNSDEKKPNQILSRIEFNIKANKAGPFFL